MGGRGASSESSGFHVTNPFGSEVETVTKWNMLVENVLEATIADMFSEIMSDHVSNAAQK